MTKNTVRLRETNKGIGIMYRIRHRRDSGRISRQRTGFEQQRPLAVQKIISKWRSWRQESAPNRLKCTREKGLGILARILFSDLGSPVKGVFYSAKNMRELARRFVCNVLERPFAVHDLKNPAFRLACFVQDWNKVHSAFLKNGRRKEASIKTSGMSRI